MCPIGVREAVGMAIVLAVYFMCRVSERRKMR